MTEQSDEDDYMSETFLKSFETHEKKNKTTLLTKSEARKRKIEDNNKNNNQNVFKKTSKIELKKQKIALENERRNNGLNNEIPKTNLGFKLLAKMGYNKNDSNSQWNLKNKSQEPVPINFEIQKKSGLGLKTHQENEKNVQEEKIRQIFLERHRQNQIIKQNFEESSRKISAGNKLFKDFQVLQRTCKDLDLKNEVVENPNGTYFWPENEIFEEEYHGEEQDSEQEREQKLTISEKFKNLSIYLRETYFYCLYCGLCYEDFDDLNKNCPGLLEDDH